MLCYEVELPLSPKLLNVFLNFSKLKIYLVSEQHSENLYCNSPFNFSITHPLSKEFWRLTRKLPGYFSLQTQLHIFFSILVFLYIFL